ncbi:hypothetical protein AA0498_2025 [Acidomonas methanolica]|nr:hypothetical protein AA0498_2025 [Acidomonas methanolica]
MTDLGQAIGLHGDLRRSGADILASFPLFLNSPIKSDHGEIVTIRHPSILFRNRMVSNQKKYGMPPHFWQDALLTT